MNFSPHIKLSYVKTLPSGEGVGFGTYGLLNSEAAWNLFYLSEPLVDVSATWSDINTYPRYSELIHPCHLETKVNKELAQALETMTPTEFLAAFKLMNYRAMEPYKILGEQWLSIMEAKVLSPRGIIVTDGNVVSVNFGSSVFSLDNPIKSFTLMPLSYLKH